MPSFLNKLRGKSNPYQNAHHPGHNQIPPPTSTSTTASTVPHRKPALPLRPVSPREASDHLAEARQAAGLDPVTGRQRITNFSAQIASQQPLAEVWQAARDERPAYVERAAKTRQTTGQRYDLFVQEMVAKRAGDAEALRAARSGKEYYAPERRVEEFYAGGVRD